MISTGNPIVDKMQTFNASGNIIPPQWFKTIVRANGKPNLNAIVILSDVVYWYKPRIVRDEVTGMITSIEKRFKADLLQRNYQQYADQFGISKREATNAIVELEKLGVVKRHLRNIQANGMTLTNVLFLELIADKVFELTFGTQVSVSQSDTSHFEKGHPLTLKSDTPNFENGEGITPKSETYTKITTKTTTKITNNIKKEVPTLPEVDTSKTQKYDTKIIPQKHKYGEFQNVLLSDEELKKLQAKFDNWQEKIDDLSFYLDSKGAKYKSHYSTILSWDRRDKKSTKLKPNNPNPDYSYGTEGVDHL